MINGRYTLQNPIGAGGMGEVYLALDHLTGEQVAIKQINLQSQQLGTNPQSATKKIKGLKLSLAREFQIMAGLRHPHILSVLDYGFDEAGHPFFTMPYLAGAKTFLDAGSKLDDTGKLKLISQLLQALAYLHRQGVLHRDIKPSNILVTIDNDEPILNVLDFGLSTSFGDNNANSSSGGTPHYLAPEIWLEQPYNASADMFAVGVLAFQLFTAHPTNAQQSHPFAPLDGFFLDRLLDDEPNWAMLCCGEEISHFLRQLLQKDPADRPTAQTTLQQLNQLLGQPVSETAEIRESYLQAAAFVGREEELGILTDFIAQTKAGQGQAVLIGGESGVGKSRLVNEIRIRALVEGFVVLHGQAVDGGGFPYQLWRKIIRRLLLMVDVTDFQAGVLKDIVPDVSVLLGRHIPSVTALTGATYQERIVKTTIDLLHQIQQPLLLMLEDLQWVTESLSLLKQILQVQDQLPMLMIVANYRDDEVPNLPETLINMTHLKLKRLGDRAVSALSQAILGEVGQNQDLIRLLQHESEGNTFFIVEIMRALAEESGQLAQIGQGALPTHVLTGGMIQLTRRRLNRIPAQYQDLQIMAALIGRQIDTQLLNHLYPLDDVEGWMTYATEYDVVAMQEDEWQFAHDKLRETLIADIPQDVKPTLHYTIAEAIEQVYPNEPAYHEPLMSHWHEAGHLEKELLYLEPVVKQMIEIHGTYEMAQTLLKNALSRLPADDPKAVPLCNWLADQYGRRGQFQEAIYWAKQAQKLVEQTTNRKGLATSLSLQGNMMWHQGAYDEATELLEQARTIFQQLGDLHGIANTLNGMAIIETYRLAYDNATDLFQQCIHIHQQLDNQRGIANILHNLGHVALLQKKYDHAMTFFEPCLTIYKQIGDQYGLSLTLGNMSHTYLYQGKYDQAEDTFKQSLEISQQIGMQQHTAMILNSIGWVRVKKREITAVEPLTQALRIASHLSLVSVSLYSVVGFAGVLTQMGQVGRACRLLGLAKGHSLTEPECQDYINELMPQLDAQLTPDELATALEAGSTLDLDEVVQELLAEFGQDGG